MDENKSLPTSSVKSFGANKKIIIIVVIIAVVAMAGFFMRGWGGVIVPGADVDRNFDGSTTIKTDEGQITVGTSSLPDNWPSDISEYKNGKIQYSGSSNPQTGEPGAVIMFLTDDSAQTVIDFYKQEFVSQGWVIEETVNISGLTVFSAVKDTRKVAVNISAAGDGQVSVTVVVELGK